MNVSGAVVSKLVIIESLDSSETQTGKHLVDWLECLDQPRGLQMVVEYVQCDSAKEFLNILEDLTTKSHKRGERPWVHVECHGDKVEGLNFANGSSLPWAETCEALRKLNVATEFNLLLVFAACFGIYFLGKANIFAPAPCWAVVAPSETVDPGEVLRAHRVFYKELYRTRDVGMALAELGRDELTYGAWLGKAAEQWFEESANRYIDDHMIREGLDNRVALLTWEAYLYDREVGGVFRDFQTMKTAVLRESPEMIYAQFFDAFFMTKEIHANIARFARLKARLKQRFLTTRSPL